MRDAQIDTQAESGSHYISFGHPGKRRLNAEGRCTFHSRLCCEVGHSFEGVDEFRPAIRIAGVVDCVHSDEDIGRIGNFGVSKCKGEKNRVAGRHISDRYTSSGRSVAVAFRHCNVRGQSGAAKQSEINRCDFMLFRAEGGSDFPGGLEFDGMPLPVVKRQAKTAIALLAGDGQGCGGV